MFVDNFIPAMATMAALSGLALAVENFKPTIKPMAFDMYGMDKDLRLHMPPMSISDIKVESWIPGKIPYACFNGEGLEGTFAMTTINPWEFHVFNVTFKDCDRSWVVCRHYNAGATELEVVKVSKKRNILFVLTYRSPSPPTLIKKITACNTNKHP